MSRSPNPDLIFSDILIQRARRVARTYVLDGYHGRDFQLDRVTLFVTHRCNLRCRYCNGPHLSKAYSPAERRALLGAEITLEGFNRWLDDWSRHGLAHLHLTGGEATLHPDLPEFVRLAAARGILVSLTSNGAAAPGLYQRLVESGLTELRLSLDLASVAGIDGIVGVAGAGERILENIRDLVAWKTRTRSLCFLILNTCVGAFNLGALPETIESLIALGPDDIKLLVIAEDDDFVCSHSSGRTRRELLAYTHRRRPDYELLKLKLGELSRPDARGLNDYVAQSEIRQCFIPLSERTLDAGHIYPCSIYLRCRGTPLGSARAGFAEEQTLINAFVEEHDCRKDPICLHNCTRCCREYNLAVNRALYRSLDGTTVIDHGVHEIDAIPADEIERAVEEDRRIREAPPVEDVHPFMIVKPLGHCHREPIRAYLAEMGFPVLGEEELPSWQSLSLLLYLKGKTGERAAFRIARNKAYGRFEPDAPALLLHLSATATENELFRIKYELRGLYGEEFGTFRYRGETHLLKATCVHVPNFEDLPFELRVIRHFRNRADPIGVVGLAEMP